MEIPPAIAAIAPDGQLTPAQRRRFMLDLCRRRIRPGTGSGPEFLARRTAMNPWPDLRSILQGIPWVIVGGVATRAYMPERSTQDLNILVHAADGAMVRERLESAGYHQFTSVTAPPGFRVYSPQGVDVKVILGKHPWSKKALAHPRQDPAGYPVLDLPYLVLMKIESSRTHDIGDLSIMLGLALDDELARVRAAVARYAPNETEDLESLIYLGQVEMGKTKKIEHQP
jgi:hypothetical protein